MFRIIESIPRKNAEPIKQQLAKLGSKRINETFDPTITVQRAFNLYRTKGYDESWIQKKLKGMQDRKKLTNVCKRKILKKVKNSNSTNEIYKE